MKNYVICNLKITKSYKSTGFAEIIFILLHLWESLKNVAQLLTFWYSGQWWVTYTRRVWLTSNSQSLFVWLKCALLQWVYLKLLILPWKNKITAQQWKVIIIIVSFHNTENKFKSTVLSSWHVCLKVLFLFLFFTDGRPREKTRAYQPFLNRLATNHSPVHPSPPTAPLAQPPKPSVQPKTQPLTTATLHPLKTQHTLNTPIQPASQRLSTKPAPSGTKDKQVTGEHRTHYIYIYIYIHII